MPARFLFIIAFGNPLIYFLHYILARSAVGILFSLHLFVMTGNFKSFQLAILARFFCGSAMHLKQSGKLSPACLAWSWERKGIKSVDWKKKGSAWSWSWICLIQVWKIMFATESMGSKSEPRLGWTFQGGMFNFVGESPLLKVNKRLEGRFFSLYTCT